MVMNDMTDDGKWGAAIPIVNGKRPEWLENNLDIPIKTAAGWKGEVDYFDGDNAGWHWENITAIRLPADHPHYQQTQPIDWSAPIEAVHEDGRVVAVTLNPNPWDSPASRATFETPDMRTTNNNWNEDGSDFCYLNQWRIRNVHPAKQTQTQTLTAQERLERLENFARRIVAESLVDTMIVIEARALVAEMEPVVDPDLAEARKLAMDHDGYNAHTGYERGDKDNLKSVQFALSCLKRGRELARGDVA